jgi:hypothetical protein
MRTIKTEYTERSLEGRKKIPEGLPRQLCWILSHNRHKNPFQVNSTVVFTTYRRAGCLSNSNVRFFRIHQYTSNE